MNRSSKPQGPQRLKPVSPLALGGTAEDVPFPKPFMKQVLLFHEPRSTSIPRLLHLLGDRVFRGVLGVSAVDLPSLQQQARHVVVLRSVAHEGIQFLKQAA
jgi:hypothetical protein